MQLMPCGQYDSSRRNYSSSVRLVVIIFLFVGFIAAIDITRSGKSSPSPLLKLGFRRKHRRNDQPFLPTHRHHRRTAKSHHHRRSSAPSLAFQELLATVNNTTPESRTLGLNTDKQIIEELLKKYRFPDSTSNISVAVLLNINRVFQADKVDEVDEVCRLQVTLIQKWTEMKLEYRQLRNTTQPIKLRSLNYIWHPALTIENALSVVPVGKDVLRVYPRGVVELIQTLKVITEADVNFLSFPFERRNCSLTFTNDDSRAIWSRVITINLPRSDEYDDNSNSLEKSFSERYDSAEFRLAAAHIGVYRTVVVELRRQLLVWVIRLFAPCMVQLFALWILCALYYCNSVSNSRSQQPTGVIVPTSILFLTITVTITINAAQSPPTNFPKASDMWNAAVFLNALAALILVAIRDASRIPDACQCYELQSGDKAQLQIPYYTQLRRRRRNVKAIMRRVFVVSTGALLLPVAFGVFFTYFFVAFVWPFYYD